MPDVISGTKRYPGKLRCYMQLGKKCKKMSGNVHIPTLHDIQKSSPVHIHTVYSIQETTIPVCFCLPCDKISNYASTFTPTPVSEWVSSFLTAHQHILGYSVPFIHSVLFTVW